VLRITHPEMSREVLMRRPHRPDTVTPDSDIQPLWDICIRQLSPLYSSHRLNDWSLREIGLVWIYWLCNTSSSGGSRSIEYYRTCNHMSLDDLSMSSCVYRPTSLVSDSKSALNKGKSALACDLCVFSPRRNWLHPQYHFSPSKSVPTGAIPHLIFLPA